MIYLARPHHESLFGIYFRILAFVLISSSPFVFGMNGYRKVIRSKRFPKLEESERKMLSNEYLAGISFCYAAIIVLIVLSP
jgi:hypothetical protein